MNQQFGQYPTAATQPHLPAIPLRLKRPRNRRGIILLTAFVMLMSPIFLCGLSLVAYLLFPPAPADILIMGIDGRGAEGLTARSDSIMLMGVNPGQLRASLLSIPRDLFIDVPEYGLERINTVNMLGEQNFGVGVDYYIRLDFEGFVDLIDAVGGVSIEVERLIVDDAYPTADGGIMSIRFEPGVQHMDGEQALIYARTRHADDDYQRAKRQQQVVSALMGKLINPFNWPSAIGVFNRSVDTNMNLWTMLTLAPPVVLGAGNDDQLVIDRNYITATGDGVAVPNYALINPWLEERFE
jgi:LCP family protein required for cell wall assembly